MYQHTSILGNLGSDPELRVTQSGSEVCNFSVAVNKRYKDRNGDMVDQTNWFRVTAWNGIATACNQYLSKGDSVLCDGEVNARGWVDRDGEARASLELTAKTVKFIGGRQRNDQHGSRADEDREDIDREYPF